LSKTLQESEQAQAAALIRSLQPGLLHLTLTMLLAQTPAFVQHLASSTGSSSRLDCDSSNAGQLPLFLVAALLQLLEIARPAAAMAVQAAVAASMTLAAAQVLAGPPPPAAAAAAAAVFQAAALLTARQHYNRPCVVAPHFTCSSCQAWSSSCGSSWGCCLVPWHRLLLLLQAYWAARMA
jgi:hypothetical protein